MKIIIFFICFFSVGQLFANCEQYFEKANIVKNVFEKSNNKNKKILSELAEMKVNSNPNTCKKANEARMLVFLTASNAKTVSITLGLAVKSCFGENKETAMIGKNEFDLNYNILKNDLIALEEEFKDCNLGKNLSDSLK